MVSINDVKQCSKCKLYKFNEDFYLITKRGKQVRASRCIQCCTSVRRNYQLLYKYNITSKDYNNLLKEQNNVCYICKTACKTGKRLAVDHCHTTQVVRKLLCTKCNTALGAVNDNVNILYEMISYLKEHKTHLKE